MIACEMSANVHDYQQEYVLPNPNEHENTSRQAKNGKLWKAGVTNGEENGHVVIAAVSRLQCTWSLNSLMAGRDRGLELPALCLH